MQHHLAPKRAVQRCLQSWLQPGAALPAGFCRAGCAAVLAELALAGGCGAGRVGGGGGGAGGVRRVGVYKVAASAYYGQGGRADCALHRNGSGWDAESTVEIYR